MTDYFDRLEKCITGWKQINADERMAHSDLRPFYTETLIFLKELKLIRAVLDLDDSAHHLDKDAGTRAIKEAKSILEEGSDES